MPHIYLSPSKQPRNIYFDGKTTEEQSLNVITDHLVEFLKPYDVKITRGGKKKEVADRITEANSLDIHYYLSLHSNAGGGRGCETYYQTGVNKSESIRSASRNYALKLNTDFAKITTTNDKDGDRGIKWKRLADGRDYNMELRGVNAVANLIEVEFHDTKEGGTWILKNQKLIGETIGKSLVEMFDLKLKPTVPEDEFYFVQTGAYKTLKEAEDAAKKVFGFTKSEVGIKYGSKNALKWIKGIK